MNSSDLERLKDIKFMLKCESKEMVDEWLGGPVFDDVKFLLNQLEEYEKRETERIRRLNSKEMCECGQPENDHIDYYCTKT